ncbi:hypothetical protein Lal_00024416 [Lupinus albus]|nr:hypothetical protein Lal_00024416 [Lupinus albus]
MEAQGTIQFMELKGQVYPALVREFYANFRYKDGKYWSMISGNLFELNDEIFMNVVGQLTKAGSLSVENRLLHYIIAYIYRKLLPYSIFISRIVDYLRIDVSDTIIVEYTDKDHLVVKASYIRWVIQDGTDNQHATAQGGAFWISTSELCFWIRSVGSYGARLNNRMDLHFQGLKDSYFAGMEQYEERQTAYSDNQFRELRSLIQSTAEAQNACFCSEFQKLSMLIRGDQNIVTSADHTDDPHPPPQP